MRVAGGRARAFFGALPRRELAIVGALSVLGAAIVIAYVIATKPIPFAGDIPEYHSEGVFFTEGRFWWSTLPFGIAHATMWKAPVYPAWVGFWYELLGTSPVKVAVVQALLLAPLGVFVTWLLGRRLFGPAVGLGAAAVIAVFPLVWEYYGLLYPEVLAVPFALLAFYLFLERAPTIRLAIAVGAVAGFSMLIRPTSVFLFAGILAAWVLAVGWRRGVGLTALAAVCAALVIAPWTIRNYVVSDGFIPISLQDVAAYGTFNDEAANDPVYPWAWRAYLADPPAVLTGPPVSDTAFRSELYDYAADYVTEHPTSLAEAFFWNGLSRFWDIRRPARAIDEAPFEGRTRGLAVVGMAIYYVLLALALVGLWRIRRRSSLLIPLLAMALAASVVFTVGSATRYRAPFEPLLAILAVSALAPRFGAEVAEPRPTAPAPAAGASR